MPAAPLPPDEAERLAALRRYDILDTPAEEGFDRITRLASHILGAPIAVVSLVDRDRQWFKSRVGLEAAETPRGQAFCGYTILGDAPLLVEDARGDARFADSPLVTGPLGIRSYAGAPLRTRCGHRIGTLCTVGTTPRAFGPGDERALVDLAAVASDQLELRRVARELRAELAERRRAEATISELAYGDPLTGLPNRRRLNEALAELARPPGPGRAGAALLLIDLDNFKEVNDSLGHDAGDALLQEVARRLRRAVREEDLVARLGGDEFAVVLRGAGRATEVAGIARKLHEEIQLPFDHRGRRIDPGCTIGVGLFPGDGAEPSQLLKAADLALYHGKGSGRRAVGFFDSAMRDAFEGRLAQTAELRQALGDDEFRLAYQPIARLEDGARAGFEALLRWQHPAKGLLAPAAFLETAERSGLILPIGEVVLRIAIGQMGAWLDAGLEPGYVAVNVAAGQLKAEDFATGVERQLAEHRVEPERLVVELTENILLDDDDGRIVAALARLHRAGVRIALDDFGTGFASLTHLKRFPIDLLKIDRSFVRDLGADASDGTIVRTIVNLAHSLGMRVVAEGVETGDQLDYLRLNGCDYAQGFLLGRPAEAGAVLPRPRRVPSVRSP